MKAIIIGSGVAGLATAIRLSQQNIDVTVLEANSYPGGKLTEFELDGFRYDAGPSLFTMPKLVDELFELCGENPRDYFNYNCLPVACHYYYEDGTAIQAFTDKYEFAREVHDKLGVNEYEVIDYLDNSANTYNKAAKIFLNNSLHKWKTWMHKDVLSAMANIYRYDIFTTMNKANKRYLKHPKLVQLFNRFATYNGSDPYRAPGILNSIPHLEHNLGTYFPEGGMHSITESLTALARRQGVTFMFNCPVREILTKNRQATGIRTDIGDTAADIVVSNMDVYHTYHKLLPQIKSSKNVDNQERSSSGIIFYWGIKRSFPSLHLHNIFFSKNYQKEFQHIFEEKSIYCDPTVYVNITSKMNAADAPEGYENWFVMVNTPCNDGQDWNELIQKVRKDVLDKLSGILRVNIEELIITEKTLDPINIEANTSSFKGSLYGTSSNSKFAAFLRHPNFTSKLNNLYFCGGSVHPGGGIPLCLLSAKIVADSIVDKQLNNKEVIEVTK